ncbi:MAG TPA: hypothetical protein VMT81_00405 [Candidatus Paceibacterota bacterium]|nr:hypothetical protein [Candidatus Paceibacterota bacterium]
MVQEQLVDYISSQVKLGVSKEAIKAALVSAGWVAGDVDDTLKKVDGGAPAQPAQPVQPVAMKPSQPMPGKPAEPQMIRVSDLVSSSGPAAAAKPSSSPMASSARPATMSMPATAMPAGKISGNTFTAARPAGGSAGPAATKAAGGGSGGHGAMIIGVVGGILVIALGGLAWYFYSQNAGLAAQISKLNGQSTDVSGQVASLQAQFEASSTAMIAQVASATAESQALMAELAFYAIPPGGGVPTAQPITISGMLGGGGKALYTLTTADGAKAYIANSTDATLGPVFKTLAGSQVTLSGTLVPGSDELTVSTIASSTAQ